MSRNERPSEQEAVRTTIVGGRPPGSGQAVGPIPRGLEVLVKKAAVDPAFKQVLLEKRAKAAEEIGLRLEPAEVTMLNAVPAAQLETIVASTKVTDLTRSAFLGRAAAVMLAALGVSTQGCGGDPKSAPDRTQSAGMLKDNPKKDLPPAAAQSPGSRPDPVEPKPPAQETTPPAPTGIRPDKPPVEPKEEPKTQPPPKEEPQPVTPPKPDPIPTSRGVRPDVPMTKGIQPDEILPPGFGADEIKKRVNAMVQLLASPDQNVRTEARQALIGMGPSILPALKEAKAPSADAGKDVQTIIETLERIEAREYYGRRSLGIRPDTVLPTDLSADEIRKRVDAMMKLLASPDQNVRTEARQALIGMGPSILPALKEAKAPSADAGKDVQTIIEALEAKAKK